MDFLYIFIVPFIGVKRYIRGLGLISSDNEQARTYYHYASDELGSITHVVKAAVHKKLEEKQEANRKENEKDCEVLNRYEYDAFGNQIRCEEQVENRFGFTGELYDPVSALLYLRARFYNPVIGRFLQEDNYYGDGLNLYVYCRNHPVKYVDPSGHGTESPADKNQSGDNDTSDYYQDANGRWHRPNGEFASNEEVGLPAPSTSKGNQRAGRLGNESTRTQNSEIADYLESQGYTIIGGGGKGPEEYLPGPNGGTKGGNYIDITAQKGDKIIRINTVDTLADGKTPTPREQSAADSINSKTGEIIILIPKGAGLGELSNYIE